MEEIVSEQIFQTQIESINSTHNNKDAITAAKICESHSDKFKGFGENSDKTCLQTINNEIYLFPNNCRFYAKNVSEINQFIFEKFDLILLDPPWWNKSVRRKRTKPGHGYDMMYNTDLSIIPINELLNVGGLVVIWSTNSPQNMKDLKSEVLPAWGLDIVAVWYWIKVIILLIVINKGSCQKIFGLPSNVNLYSPPVKYRNNFLLTDVSRARYVDHIYFDIFT